MYTGWRTDGNKKYYYDSNGRLALGLKKVGSNQYYFKSNGEMATGWQTIDGVKYYFNKTTGVLEKVDDSTSFVAFIKKYKNVRYVSGGASPSGWDCSGFTQWALKQKGITIPRTAAQQAKGGKAVSLKDRSKWKVGDILVYSSGGRVNHVALYLGNNQLMHALNTKYNTLIQDVDYYERWDKKNTLISVRRY